GDNQCQGGLANPAESPDAADQDRARVDVTPQLGEVVIAADEGGGARRQRVDLGRPGRWAKPGKLTVEIGGDFRGKFVRRVELAHDVLVAQFVFERAEPGRGVWWVVRAGEAVDLDVDQAGQVALACAAIL